MNDSIKITEIHDRLIVTGREHLRQQGVILVSDIRNSISRQMHENGSVMLDINTDHVNAPDYLVDVFIAINKELQLADTDFVLLPSELEDLLAFVPANKLLFSDPGIFSQLPNVYYRPAWTVFPIKKFKLVVLNDKVQIDAFKSELTKDPHLLQWTNVTIVCINYC